MYSKFTIKTNFVDDLNPFMHNVVKWPDILLIKIRILVKAFYYQKQSPGNFLEKFAKFIGKHLCQGLFFKSFLRKRG